MQISGKQWIAVGLTSFAAYEVSKCFMQGTSYASIAKIALSLFGSAAVMYANQTPKPKKKVSDETLDKAKMSLQQVLQADATPTEVKEMFKAVGIDVDEIDAGKSDKLALMAGYGTLSMIYRYLDVADDKEKRYWQLFMEDMKAIEKRPSILENESNVKNSIVSTHPTRETPFTRFKDNW